MQTTVDKKGMRPPQQQHIIDHLFFFLDSCKGFLSFSCQPDDDDGRRDEWGVDNLLCCKMRPAGMLS